MICRICTLTENAQGKPRKNQFAANVHHISEEASGWWVCARNARNRRHKNLYFLWRHSANLYAVYTKRSRIADLEAAPMNGLRLRPYAAQTTHAWRVYLCDGNDSSLPVGERAVKDRLMIFTSQPPAVVDADHLLVIGTFSIKKITPTVPGTIAGYELVGTADNTVDAQDDPSESEDLDI